MKLLHWLLLISSFYHLSSKLTAKSNCCTSFYLQDHFSKGSPDSMFLSHLSYAPLPFSATTRLLYLTTNALPDYQFISL